MMCHVVKCLRALIICYQQLRAGDVRQTVIGDATSTHEIRLVADEDDGGVAATVMSQQSQDVASVAE